MQQKGESTKNCIYHVINFGSKSQFRAFVGAVLRDWSFLKLPGSFPELPGSFPGASRNFPALNRNSGPSWEVLRHFASSWELRVDPAFLVIHQRYSFRVLRPLTASYRILPRLATSCTLVPRLGSFAWIQPSCKVIPYQIRTISGSSLPVR